MHQRKAASASIALAPITDVNRTRWWQQVSEKCYAKCYLVNLMPLRIAFCVEDVSFEGLLTRRHSQTSLPFKPSLRRVHEVGLPHDRCCTCIPEYSTNSLGSFGWIAAFRDKMSRSTSRMLFACSSGPIDLWIREMTGVSRLASIPHLPAHQAPLRLVGR